MKSAKCKCREKWKGKRQEKKCTKVNTYIGEKQDIEAWKFIKNAIRERAILSIQWDTTGIYW